MVVNLYGAYAYWSACIEQVARLQREILGDVAHQFVNLVEHIARTAFLHRLSVDVQMEVQRLDVEELLLCSHSLICLVEISDDSQIYRITVTVLEG